jgi:protein-S-isoprenylcysteine O-methyltransferase Ste14
MPARKGGQGGLKFMSGTTFFVVAFLAVVGLQRLLETFKRRGTIAGQQQMRWSFYGFFILHTLIMVGAFVEFMGSDRALRWPATVAGLALYAASLVVRNVAIRALGRFWSLQIEIRSEHQLIREGIYNYVRHPAYLAITLEVLSIPLTVNAWWTVAFAALTYVPLLVYRLRVEERALVEKFGDGYRSYQREVGALWPRWSRKA